MMTYEETTVVLPGPVEVEGRIVDVLRYNPNARTARVLVEKPGPDNLTFAATDDAEGVTARVEEGIDVLQVEKPTCAGTKSNDKPCTREVDEPGDFCWQHEDQAEDEDE